MSAELIRVDEKIWCLSSWTLFFTDKHFSEYPQEKGIDSSNFCVCVFSHLNTLSIYAHTGLNLDFGVHGEF